jgi:chitinase
MKQVIKKTVVLLIMVVLVGCVKTPPETTTYKLTYDYNDGDEITSIDVEQGNSVELINAEKEGSTFLGWTTVRDDITTLVEDPYTPDSDVILYALWDLDQYILTFDTKGAGTIDAITVDSGSSVLLPMIDKEGYTFLGWTLIEDDEESIVSSPYVPDYTMTLFATWEINQYTVTFETDGGSVIDGITVDYDAPISIPTQPTKEGYIFDGWYISDAFTEEYVFSTMPAENLTLFAKWVEVDWSEIETYISGLFTTSIEEDITLPETYNDYSIIWESSDVETLSNSGEYTRQYMASTIQLTATITFGIHTYTYVQDVEVKGYKSLAAPITSSYIYTGYNTVSDSFFQTLDIINCAFLIADETGGFSSTGVLSNISAHILPEARDNGNWVIVSIAPESEWSDIAKSATRINTFADNIVDIINQYGLDGVDIDWEYPEHDESENFTAMMEVIYTKVKANNPHHLVTAAIAGGMWQPVRYDLENSAQYIDYINMMTYGMVSNNGYYQNALYRSTSYAEPTELAGKTLTSCSIEESIVIYNNLGVPNSKIIVGVAFYGIVQSRTYNQSTQTWSAWVKDGWLSYSSIKNNYLNNPDYTYHYDNNAGVPYLMKNDGTKFISYDNPKSIIEKSEYIIDNGLAGIMYWQNGLDTTGALLSAINSTLNE